MTCNLLKGEWRLASTSWLQNEWYQSFTDSTDSHSSVSVSPWVQDTNLLLITDMSTQDSCTIIEIDRPLKIHSFTLPLISVPVLTHSILYMIVSILSKKNVDIALHGVQRCEWAGDKSPAPGHLASHHHLGHFIYVEGKRWQIQIMLATVNHISRPHLAA